MESAVWVRIVAGALLAAQAFAVHAQESTLFLEKSKAWGTAIADYNGDGHDDIYITGHDKNDRIWYWTKKGYRPSPQVLKWSDRHDCDAADYDHDGLMDFYCAVGAEQGKGTGTNELWKQGSDQVFTMVQNHGAEDIYGRSRIPKFFDLNHDGWADIYLTNFTMPRTDGQPNLNRVFINQAGTGFTELTTAATGPYGSICLEKGDIDHDGWDDLVVCSDEGIGHLFLNNRANDFIDLPVPGGGAWADAKLVDMNHDGLDDLVVLTTANVLQLWFNSGSGNYFETLGFEQVLPAKAVSLAVGDFDLDGSKDIYVVLQDAGCEDERNPKDRASDWLFKGQSTGGFTESALVQTFNGCGHKADVVDGSKILLLNGGNAYKGPNYLITIGQ